MSSPTASSACSAAVALASATNAANCSGVSWSASQAASPSVSTGSESSTPSAAAPAIGVVVQKLGYLRAVVAGGQDAVAIGVVQRVIGSGLNGILKVGEFTVGQYAVAVEIAVAGGPNFFEHGGGRYERAIEASGSRGRLSSRSAQRPW
jgi:hypothetical protein